MARRVGTLALLFVGALASGCWLPEPFQRLSHRVQDAEYSESLGLVVSVAFRGMELHLYDPITRSETHVALSAGARSVAVSPDGSTAAIGQVDRISIVDLASRTVTATYPVSFEVNDLVIAANGFVYFTPAVNVSSNRLHALDLATGVATAGTNSLGRLLVVQLQPDGRTLLVTDQGGYNTILSKFDISGGIPRRVTDTISGGTVGASYHDYPVCGRLWPSDDGARVWTGCGNAFDTSLLHYRGSFEHSGEILSLAHAGSQEAILALSIRSKASYVSQQGEIQLYGDTYLDYRGSKSLPPFVQNGELHSSRGRFVFFDEARRSFVVILEPYPVTPAVPVSAVYLGVFNPRAFRDSRPAPLPPPIQAFTTLDQPAVDAEYSSTLERIVYVTALPAALHALDPESGDDRVVPLPLPPTCVSVGPDGLHAVVGHDGWLSHVDLEQGVLLDLYPIAASVDDCILGDGWMYGNQLTLRAIEIATGAEVVAGYYGSGARIQRHPSGDAIYAYQHMIPAGHMRFDLDAGIPRFGANDPYHGEHQPCYGLWISEDGTRLFSSCVEVFRAAPGMADDMTFERSFDWVDWLGSVADSAEAGRTAAIAWDGDPGSGARIELFASSDLQHVGTRQLPPFVFGEVSLDSFGRFLFFNANGTKIHVVMEAELESGERVAGVVSFDAL